MSDIPLENDEAALDSRALDYRFERWWNSVKDRWGFKEEHKPYIRFAFFSGGASEVKHLNKAWERIHNND